MSSRNLRRKPNSERKKKIYKSLVSRDGAFCFWCGDCFESIFDYTLDHLIPRSHGGTYELVNLVLACDRCNNQRANLPAGKFAKMVREGKLQPKKALPIERERRVNRLNECAS